MAFQHGLSGLNASSKNLDVIGHNIANANTTGFKSSRAEFADLVASSMGAGGGANYGIGVEVAAVKLNYGMFVQNVVDFLIVAFCVFLLVKGINTLRRKQEAAATK